MTVTRPTHPRTRIPPLQNGDRLTRPELEDGTEGEEDGETSSL
jgi:hypothetical protein